jgi:hypothetical protein
LQGASAYTNGSDGWWRSDGQAGWYNATYAVGIYATDSTYVRTYNGAQFYSSSIIEAGASVRGPIFYDSNNTGYYVDPSSLTYLYQLTLAGGGYFRPNNWIQLDGSYGLYWPNNYGAHLHANDLSTYTQFALRGSKNSYGGIYDQYSAVNIAMYDSSGNGGVYREANGRWFSYYHVGNNCWGFGTSSTSSAYNIYCPTGVYSGGRVDGTIFYDANNTGYYVDPNSTSRMGTINADVLYSYGNVTAYSDERLKKDWEDLAPNFVALLARIKSGTYTRIDSGERQVGVGAQSLQTILKEAVSEKEQYLGVNYGNAAMVSAVELAKYVTALEQRIQQLEARL